MTAQRAAKVSVPATSANLGPGFDTLGLALDIRNTLELREAPSAVCCTGEGARAILRSGAPLIHRTLDALYTRAKRTLPSLAVTMHNGIPLNRGLGSSSAAIVGTLVAGNELLDRQFSQEDLLNLAWEIEGHPDNVSPCLLGGLVISVPHNKRLVYAQPPVTAPPVVLYIPTVPLSTTKARGVLPPEVPYHDAVFNLGHTALLVHALLTGDWSHLGVAMLDALHQPYRAKVFPQMQPLLDAALEAGAWGAALSGSGSTILAFAANPDQVARALEETAARLNLPGQSRITQVSREGARVTSVQEGITGGAAP